MEKLVKKKFNTRVFATFLLTGHFAEHQYWRLLSFYDLRLVLETFLTSFPMSLEILNFYESPTVMETEIASFPMY